MTDTLRTDARRIVHLAWPLFVGQLSVVAFSTVDTFLVARHSEQDLAALAVGASAYITVFIGLMGVVLGMGPLVGRQFGAGRLEDAGRQTHQAVWVALGLSALGCTLLAFPYPFLALSRATPEVAARVQGYLQALALSLPASLLFTVYRGFNNAVSRPREVMALQITGLAIKLPLSTALVWGVPAIGLPAMGVVGCGVATAVAMWSQALLAFARVRRDPYYQRFALLGHGLRPPDPAALRQHLGLGIPMGASILVEVTGFSFMAIFIARLGTTAVAGHQIAANLAAILFMMPLALGNASSTLVAQRIGAGAHDEAVRLSWRGLQLGTVMAMAMAGAVFLAREAVVGAYTRDAAVAAAALPLLSWLFLFHVADAIQGIATFVLRAWHVAKLPLLIHTAALWGVGLAGGYFLAFGSAGTGWLGAAGFWTAAAAGLVVAALALAAVLFSVLRSPPRDRPRWAARGRAARSG